MSNPYDEIAEQMAKERRDAEGAAAGVAAIPSTRLPAAPMDFGGKPPLDTSVDVLEPGGEVAPVGGGSAPGVPVGQAAPPSRKESPYDAIARQMREEQERENALQAQLLQWRAANDKADPGKRADVLRYSAASGLAPDFVEKNLDAVRRKVDAEKVDWNLVAYRQPSLRGFLLSNPELTPLVKDDAANLGGIEWALWAPMHAFWDAVNQQRTVARQFLEAQGWGDEENRQRIRELEAQYGEKDYGAENFLEKGYIGAAKMVPYLVLDTAARFVGGALGKWVGGAIGAAGGAAGGAPAAGVGAVPGGAAGGAVGGALGGLVGQYAASGLFNYYESVGPLYWRLSQLKDANGDPLPEDVARAFAQGGGVLSGALMAGFMGKVGGNLPGVKQLLAKVSGNAVEKALVSATTAQVVKRGAVRFGTHWVTGAVMMGAQSGLNAAAEEGAKAYANAPSVDEEGRAHRGQSFEVQWNNVSDAMAHGFKAGLEDMWLISAIGPGRDMLWELGRARTSAESAARLEAMTESAKASKLLERLPEGFQEFARRAKEEKGAVQNVFVPVEEWTAYWQGKKLDPGEVAAAVVGDGGKAFSEAAATKGDLAIPVEKYLARLAKTEHAPALLPDMKLHADELTPRQMKAEEKRLQERLKEEAKLRGEEFEQGKKEVRDYIYEQALGAGIDKKEAEANAKLVSEYAGNLALRLGVSVGEAASLGALGRLRILGPKGETVAAATRERFQRFLQPSASRYLEERAPTLSKENRAREYFIDPVSGLRHRRAWDAAERQSGKQVAVITSPDVKGINDHPTAGGHDVANELLRAMGAALFEHDAEAARSGTSFLLHVDGPEQLEQVLASVRKTLGNEHLNVLGGLGATEKEAFAALDLETKRRRGELTAEEAAKLPPLRPEEAIPKRADVKTGETGLKPGLDVAGLKFREGRAKAEVPKHLVEELGALGDKEYAQKAYLDRVEVDGEPLETGLLSREGWDNIPRKAHVASIDLRGLKAANEKYGKNAGNAMLAYFAETAAHFGGSSFDMAHLSGDEYAAQHNDPLKLERFVKRLEAQLAERPIEAVDPASGKWEPVSVQFRHGFGRDYGRADRDLNVRKRREAQAGERAGGREADLRAGDVDSRNAAADQGGPGGMGRGRGASRQGFLDTGLDQGPLTGGGETSFGSSQLSAARAAIGRMRGERQARAAAFLDYAIGLAEARPTIEPALERELAKYEVVDPHNPYAWDEQNRSLEVESRGVDAGLRRGRKAGEEPASLREYRMRREGTWLKYEQLPLGHIEGRPLVLHAGEPKDPRGTIRLKLDETGQPVAFDIQVLKGDKSTFLHETAHFLSWSLHDVARSDLATPDLRRDYEALLKWAGYPSAEERMASMDERSTLARKEGRSAEEEARLKALSAKEERISHGWEQYLLEGKAPSEGLARVFAKFREWLLRIYRGVEGVQAQYRAQYGEEIGLSDEVRGVFDRLLAQEQALERARAETGTPAAPPPLVTARMTPEEREAYRKALVDSRLAAEQELAQKTAELLGEQVDAARARISAEVAAELDRQPVYRAMRYLQRGELVDAEGKPLEAVPQVLLDKDGKPFKLGRKAFVDTYGPDVARLMPPGVFDRNKRGGVDVEQLAPLLGFESADELVGALRTAEPRDKAIANRTQDRVEAEYSPALKAVQGAALSAIHNEAAVRATLLGLRALAKQVNPQAAARVKSVDLATHKATAERLVAEMPVGELDPARYARTERETALKAAELWGAGEREKSLEQQEARLFNQLLYRAARDAQEQLERVHDKLEGTSESVRADMGKADPSYRDAHDQLLAAVGLGEPLVGGRTLDDFLKLAEENAQEVAFDVDFVRRLLAKPQEWKALTVAQAREVADAVTNIRHLARETLKLELAGQKQTKEAWFAELQGELKGRKPVAPEPLDPVARTVWDKAKHLGRGADALLTDVSETYSHMLDVGNREGPVHRLLVDARLEAREKAGRLEKEVLKRVLETWDNVPKEVRKLLDKRVDLEGILPVPPGTEGRLAPVYTRATLWMLFLNWGNEGNRQRIRDGNGWSDEQVSRALSLLTPQEARFLQGVLDTIDSLYPEVAATHERRTGLKLGKVEATPILVNGEEFQGGYFPLKYRSDVSRPGEYQEGAVVKALFAPNYYRPTTPKSHTKERQERVKAPVDLNWGVVPAHLSQVIHDLSYGEWVRQAGSVVMDPRFKDLAARYLGKERTAEVVPWLRDVANARADSAAGAQSEFLAQVGAFARNRAAVAVMGLNMPAIGAQVLDAWNARQEGVPARHIAAAYAKGFLGLARLPEVQASTELAYRRSYVKDNLRARLGEIGPTGRGLGKAVSETYFALYEVMDRYTSRVTFKAAYDAALSEGHTHEKAVKHADDVVRRTYASHDLAEKPRIMRTKQGLGGLLMFYSFANRLYNSQRRSFDTLEVALRDERSTPGDKTRAVAEVAAKLMFLGLTGAAYSYLAGRGPKKDEDWREWMAWRLALEPFNTVPFAGGILERGLKGQRPNVRTAPELALVVDAIDRIGDGVMKARTAHDEEAVWGMAEALLGVGLLLGGAPVGQIERTGGYLKRLSTGEARPRGALDVASGLYFGERDDQPANPLTDAQDLLQR